MSKSKSRPPITYANTLDAKSIQKSSSKAKPSKSPESARPAFSGQTRKTPQQKASHREQAVAPRAEPKLQPKGMGEYGVNWQAHASRLRKAKKAVQINRTASKSFNRLKSTPSRGR